MRLLFFAIITVTGIGNWNRHKKPLVCRLQNENGIVTPLLPLNAIVAQRGASWGIYQREKKRTKLRCGSRSERPASIANGVPFAAETGEPVPLFGLQEKGWRQTASQFTSDGQCPPKYRNLQYLQIEVKNLFHPKVWSQNIKKRSPKAVLREVWLASEDKKQCQYCTQTWEKIW